MTTILRDPATGLDCTETPFYPPRAMSLSDVTTCASCSLIIAAPTPGPKNFIVRGAHDGMGIDESPLAMLTFNGSNYSLYETVLWRNGAHRNFKTQANYDLELNLYFHDIYEPSKQVAVAIPITIDDRQAKPYFTELADQNIGSRQYTLETLIVKDSPVLTYKGMDLRNRTKGNPRGASQCASVDGSMTWFILPSTYISQHNANRIRSIDYGYDISPAAPDHELALERARNLTMVIAKIQIKSEADAAASGVSSAANSQGIYLTRALQCQRINPLTDVRNDAVYLKNPPTRNTLADELDAAAALDKTLDDISSGSVRPKDIEFILSVCVGVAVGIIIFSIIAYFILQVVYKGYLPAVVQEPAVIDAAMAMHKLECNTIYKNA